MASFKTYVPGPGKSESRCSVVDTLLKRELGFPVFAKSADLMSNGVAEKAIGRQLLYARIPSSPDESLNVDEVKLDETLKTSVKSVNSHGCVPRTWFAVKVEKRAQVRYIDGLLWKSVPETGGNFEGQTTFANTFFKPEPRGGFKIFNGFTAQGKLMEFEVISSRALTTVKSQLPTFLIMLRANGLVHVTNLSSIDQLKSTTTLSLCQPSNDRELRFTDMSLDCETQQMFVLASKLGWAKSLYIIQYPSWRIKTIIHIEVSLKIQLWSSILMTHDANSVEVMGVSTLVDISEKFPLPEQSKEDDYTNVRVLTNKPTLGIKISTSDAFFGLIDTTWPPLYYMRTKTGLKVHTFLDSNPIWEDDLGPYTCYLFQIMPDSSNAVLFTKDDDQYMITWKKQTDDPPTYIVNKHLAFQLQEPEKSPTVTSVGGSRPTLQRACKISPQKLKNEPTTRVLSMDYFDHVDLIAVCAVYNGRIIVSVYEAMSFKLFKSLPPPQIVDSRNSATQSSDSDDSGSFEKQSITKLDKIARVDLVFDYDMMFMHLHYDTSSEAEMFGIRLLQENAPEQL